jgi:hypothetical protein
MLGSGDQRYEKTPSVMKLGMEVQRSKIDCGNMRIEDGIYGI